MMGVLLHVIGDAANNLGVIIAALVIWLARYEGRYYADPGTSMGIAIMIILSSFPLGRFICQPAVTVTENMKSATIRSDLAGELTRGDRPTGSETNPGKGEEYYYVHGIHRSG